MPAPEKYDEILESTIGELRAALDGIPHGTAKTLAGPIEALVGEARWLNWQRDWARGERDNTRAALQVLEAKVDRLGSGEIPG